MNTDTLHAAPPTPDCQVLELRQYTLHRGRRDELIELFDREFVETQEAVGMAVIGQFRDLDDADRFAWLRGFADMGTRLRGLQAFYGGPVWAAHRDAANATMIDSDDVRLLRPAWPGSALAVNRALRAPPGAVALPPGLVVATVLTLRAAPDQALLAQCRRIDLHTARQQAWYATEPAVNDFARLPVRTDAPVLVHLALVDDAAAAQPLPLQALQPWLAAPAEVRRWAPTARSALHA